MKNYFKDQVRIVSTIALLAIETPLLIIVGIYNWYTLSFTTLTLVLIIAMYREANKK